MIDLEQVKVTPRDQQVLNLLVQGCRNEEIAGQLNISPRTVQQHPCTLFLRAGIREGRKRVNLAIAMFTKVEERLTAKEIQIAISVWEGLTNREIEDRGHQRTSDKEPFAQRIRQTGSLDRLELAMYVASHGGKDWAPESEAAPVRENEPNGSSKPKPWADRIVHCCEQSLHRQRWMASALSSLNGFSPNSAKPFTTVLPLHCHLSANSIAANQLRENVQWHQNCARRRVLHERAQ